MLRTPSDPIEPAASVMLALLTDDRDGFRPVITSPASVAGGLIRILLGLGVQHYGSAEAFAAELETLLTAPIPPRPIDNEENR